MELTRRRLGVAGTAAVLTTPATSRAQQGSLAGPPIRIGLGIAMTGGLAGGGRAGLLAIQLWAEDVNSRGGLLGRRVEIVALDDQSSPANVPALYTKLLDVDRVDLVVSGYATTVIAAAMPTVVQRGKVFMGLFGLAVAEQYKYDRFFQIQPNGPNARTEFSKGFYELAMALEPKPQSVALVGADAEYSILALDGARENARKHGLRVTYDRTYPPNAVEFSSIVRAIRAGRPDLVFIASYPPDSAGMVRAISEVGLTARMVGGGMIGLQFAALKEQLGPLLNGLVCYDLYVPEPTMQFPGIEAFLARYQAVAARQGVDPLGYYIPPFAYAQMQILEAGIKGAGSLDDGRIAEYIRSRAHPTVVGDVRFTSIGEWAEPQLLLVQYQGIQGNGLQQFTQPGRQAIVYPPRFRSGELRTPFTPTRN